MSTKNVRTAADLVRFRCGLKIDCGSCGSSRTMDGFEAVQIGDRSIGGVAATVAVHAVQ